MFFRARPSVDRSLWIRQIRRLPGTAVMWFGMDLDWATAQLRLTTSPIIRSQQRSMADVLLEGGVVRYGTSTSAMLLGRFAGHLLSK